MQVRTQRELNELNIWNKMSIMNKMCKMNKMI